MSGIERALSIALEVHGGQKDKAGKPYILHVLRVMRAVPEGDAQVVALLHDVPEDAARSEDRDYPWGLERLEDNGFAPKVLAALEALTHLKYEPYVDYIERVARNDLARTVKIADLTDNADVTRIASPNAKDLERTQKYLRALERLTSGSGV